MLDKKKKNLSYLCTICFLFFLFCFSSMHKLSASLSPLKLSVVFNMLPFICAQTVFCCLRCWVFIRAQTACCCLFIRAQTACGFVYSVYPYTNCLFFFVTLFSLSLHKLHAVLWVVKVFTFYTTVFFVR